MKRLWQLVASFALLCLFACGASAPAKLAAPAPPKPPEDPWSWVPENAALMGRITLSELRKTPFWPLWTDFERAQQLSSWVALDKVDQLTFGGTGKSQEDLSLVASLEGTFSPTELRDLAARDQVAPEVLGLLTVYRRPEGVWTQITPRLIVMATADRLEALVARASAGPGAKAKDTPLYRSLADRVELSQAHVGVIAEDPDGSYRALIERRASRIGLGSLTRESLRLGVALQVGAEYRIVAASEAADDARAQAQLTEVRDTLEALSRNFIVRMIGVGPLLSKLHVSGEGNYVYVRGNLPEVELANAIKRVHGALGLAAGFGL